MAARRKTRTGRSLRAVGASPALQAEQEQRFIDALEQMNPDYKFCRALQHGWAVSDPMRLVDTTLEEEYGVRKGHREYVVEKLFCSRCTMGRRDFYAISEKRGHTILVKIGYDYQPPPDYSVKGTGNVRGLRQFLLGSIYEDAVFNRAQAKPWTSSTGRRRPGGKGA